MPSKTMNPTLGDLLKREYSSDVVMEAVTQVSGQNLLLGTLLGRVLVDTTAGNTVAAAVGGNTGNGTIAMNATPVRAGVRAGAYRVVFTGATTFNVVDPQGDVIGAGTTGVLFQTEVAFTITAGGTAFVAGDAFTITVPEGNRQVRQLAATAQPDGSHFLAGILAADTDASAGAVQTLMIARGPAVVSANAIIWPAGLNTAALRAPYLRTLEAVGIVARTTA